MDLMSALNGNGVYDPAVGHMIATNPAAAIQVLIAKDVPPPADIPEGTPAHEAAGTLGQHLMGYAGPDLPGEGLRKAGEAALPSPESLVEAGKSAGFGAPLITYKPGLPTPPLIKGDASPVVTLPSPPKLSGDATPIIAQGAEEVPLPRPRPPTPAPEGAQATESAARPEPASGQVPPEGQDSRPKPKPAGGGGDLGAVLAGLSAIKPPVIPHLATPPPYHATNQISRSNIPQVLMQELTGAARPASMLRLGQALKGG